jgi:hypothetical protein
LRWFFSINNAAKVDSLSVKNIDKNRYFQTCWVEDQVGFFQIHQDLPGLRPSRSVYIKNLKEFFPLNFFLMR